MLMKGQTCRLSSEKCPGTFIVTYLFIQEIFTKSPLSTKNCARYWELNDRCQSGRGRGVEESRDNECKL